MTARAKPPEARFEHTLPGVGGQRSLDHAGIRADVHIVPLEGGHRRLRAETEDVSARGIFIATPRGYPLGTLLGLTLCTAHGELTVKGRVVHLLRGIGFSCEFIDLTERQRVALSYLMSLSASAPPAVRTLRRCRDGGWVTPDGLATTKIDPVPWLEEMRLAEGTPR